MSAPDWQLTSPLYAGNAAYLEQFGDAALAPWLAQPLPGAAPNWTRCGASSRRPPPNSIPSTMG